LKIIENNVTQSIRLTVDECVTLGFRSTGLYMAMSFPKRLSVFFPRLYRKSPPSARERAILAPGKDGDLSGIALATTEAGDIGFIVDGAGCSQPGQLRLPLSDSSCVSSDNNQSKGPLKARATFPKVPAFRLDYLDVSIK